VTPSIIDHDAADIATDADVDVIDTYKSEVTALPTTTGHTERAHTARRRCCCVAFESALRRR
jgi:hypothetical protein